MNKKVKGKLEPIDIPDYTEWQRGHFSGMSVEELNEKAAAATENYVPPKNVKIL